METKRLLIVDDVLQVRKDLRILLSLIAQVEVVGDAANGEEAIEKAGILRPDIVLMDLEMPVMDGYRATQKIKDLSPACRVVALTVHGYGEARQKALQAGVDDFIVKGEPVECLIQAILDRTE
jgi:DNA-binding NarL/FixJ family response regulator